MSYIIVIELFNIQFFLKLDLSFVCEAITFQKDLNFLKLLGICVFVIQKLHDFFEV